MKKRCLVLVAIFLISFSWGIGAHADSKRTSVEQAEILKQLGIFKGSDKGFELARKPTRAEGVVLLVRLLGKEEDAKDKQYAHPFEDVPDWASPYVGYMYKEKLTNGQSSTEFGSTNTISAAQYCTFVLRALGYDDKKGDFQWDQSVDKAVEIGLISEEDALELKSKEFVREDVVKISYNALFTNLKKVE